MWYAFRKPPVDEQQPAQPQEAPAPKLCLSCEKRERHPETTDGVFCGEPCERQWIRNTVGKMDLSECMELIAEVISRVPAEERRIEEEADEARRFCRAFVATA